MSSLGSWTRDLWVTQRAAEHSIELVSHGRFLCFSFFFCLLGYFRCLALIWWSSSDVVCLPAWCLSSWCLWSSLFNWDAFCIWNYILVLSLWHQVTPCSCWTELATAKHRMVIQTCPLNKMLQSLKRISLSLNSVRQTSPGARRKQCYHW